VLARAEILVATGVVVERGLARLEHHPVGARQPRLDVAAQCVIDRIRRGERTRDHHPVLDSHGGTLAEEGEHRMRRVADQRDATTGPFLKRLAIEEGPLEQPVGWSGGDDRPHALVPVGVLFEHFFDRGAYRPALLAPVVALGQADEIDQFTAAHQIARETAAWPGR
jgi:hypothetical protein